MLTVAIDASTYRGTVAVIDGRTLLAEGEAPMRGEKSEHLMPLVTRALADAKVTPRRIRRVVCGAGPGSFTSLRIAASIAKGLATGAGCDLVAISSPLLIVAGARPALPAGRYLAVLDALRGQCFAAEIEVTDEGAVVERGLVALVPADSLEARAQAGGATIVGPGRSWDLRPHARGMLAIGSLEGRPPVDLGTWEPDYGRAAEAQVRWEAAHGRPLPGP